MRRLGLSERAREETVLVEPPRRSRPLASVLEAHEVRLVSHLGTAPPSALPVTLDHALLRLRVR